jgi:hypothetical protein
VFLTINRTEIRLHTIEKYEYAGLFPDSSYVTRYSAEHLICLHRNGIRLSCFPRFTHSCQSHGKTQAETTDDVALKWVEMAPAVSAQIPIEGLL